MSKLHEPELQERLGESMHDESRLCNPIDLGLPNVFIRVASLERR